MVIIKKAIKRGDKMCSNKKINVTKSYLPPIEEYVSKISKIWDNHFLTNYGPLNQELVTKLENYLNVTNLHYVNNGTTAIQLALDSMNITSGDIITTPFTFIATTNSILWQRCNPVFVDINEYDFNIDVNKIEEKITKKTKAILAVHCFGIPCDIIGINKIAKKYNLRVIYDAAHSFGTKIGNKSVLSYGDISCCSLHATKVFHSVEGGLCIVNNKEYNEKLNSIKNFGNNDGSYKYVGINAKNSEFHAAMGLCLLDHIEEIINKRKKIYNYYIKCLNDCVYIPKLPKDFTYNYIYFPILFNSEEELLKVFKKMNQKNIYPRRYFYPAINDLEFYKTYEDSTPIASDISKRIACLPLDTYLNEEDIETIASIIKKIVNCNKK